MTDSHGCVVVGGGLAAATLVGRLRADGFAEPVMVIGDEPVAPYERPALSKDFLLGKAERDSLFVHPETWYADNEVELVLGDRVTSIDRGSRAVTLDSRRQATYGRLVLATGARPRKLPLDGIELAGVHLLRRIGDSEALRSAIESGPRVAVVGAGWIGLEVAAAARVKGCDVVVLETAEVPLAAALGPDMGSYFADLHRSNGVDLRTGVSVSGLVGSDGAVAGVRVGDELVDADLVLIGVGARPNVELAEVAGLPVGNGVLADSRLRTADPAILVAGDVAAADNVTLGAPVRVEHWDNAIRQGQLAAATILGQGETYDWQPYFYTDQFDLGMEYVGLGRPNDEVVVRGDMESGEFVAFWTRHGRLTAAMNVNVWDVNDTLRGLLGRVIAVDRLRDESLSLSDL
jgi:3-phenylpropionate/trans-cinnamate dioxygenase ferredoxin reductase component